MTQQTQGKILDSAQSLFWKHGHKATSLDAIAESAGQSKGALFHYFKNKKDITRTALNHYVETHLFTPMERAFTDGRNIRDALLGWVEGVYNTYSEQGYEGGCLLGNMALELSDQDEDIRQELSRIFLEWENRLVGFLRDGENGQQLLMEPRQFARVVIAGLQGVTLTIKVHKDKNRAAREFQALGDMIMHLVRP